MFDKLKATVVVAALLLIAAPALAGGARHYPRGRGPAPLPERGAFRISLGLFTPDGNSQFWDDNAFEFTGDVEDLEDASVTAELLMPINRAASLLVSAGAYEGESLQAYRDFVDEAGFDIVHESRLAISPLTLGVVVFPAGRQRSITPYLGAGGGLYFWSYEEAGDFIVFDALNEPVEIITTGFQADGVALGYYLLAGVDFPISPAFSVFAEGRWQQAEDEQKDDFEGLGDIDLSGHDFRAGLSWKF